MKNYQTIGFSIPKVDAIAKVTGTASFASDFSRPGMLVGKILLSDRPHAKIIDIDIHAALELLGVHAVVSSGDTLNKPYGGYLLDKPIFASDRVRHIGEPIAAIAADSEEIAEQGLNLVKVKYEDLEPVFTVEAALEANAPILHPGLESYACAFPYIRYANVCMDAHLKQGDVEKGFSEADEIVEETYYCRAMHQAYLEPYACVADIDQNGHLIVWTGTQQLSVCHRELATALGLSMSEVRVIPLWMGGAFGGKLGSRFEPIAALLAKKARRPVRIALTRKEDFFASHGRAPFTIKIKTGVCQNGTIVAWKSDILVDTGAYSDEALGSATVALAYSNGPYRFPNSEGRSRAVYTNNPDWGCMRGYGCAEIGYALESHLDLVAERIGMDPVELRLKHIVEEGDPTITGQKLNSVSIRETMIAALKASGYYEKKGHLQPYHGIGIANHMGESGLLGSSAVVRANEDATITILTSIVDLGTGTHTALCQIVAEVLGLPVDHVHIASLDSDSAPYDIGVFASKTIFDSGNAVRLAAEDLRLELINLAADVFGCERNTVTWDDGTAYVNEDPEKRLSLPELVGISLYVRHGPLIGKGSRVSHSPFDKAPGDGFGNSPTGSFLFGTHIAEVEVDPATGKCKILNYVACHDVGKTINPVGAEGQIDGGVIQGIGYGLMEETICQNGEIMNASLSTYLIPTVADIPPMKSILLEKGDPNGPFGAKGLGEPPSCMPMPALTNAIRDATGVGMTEIPMTPEKIFRAIRNSDPQEHPKKVR